VVTGVLILVFVAEETNSTTYEGTVEAACGPVVKVFAELCLLAFCFGSNTAYLVVIEDQLEDGKHCKYVVVVVVVVIEEDVKSFLSACL